MFRAAPLDMAELAPDDTAEEQDAGSASLQSLPATTLATTAATSSTAAAPAGNADARLRAFFAARRRHQEQTTAQRVATDHDRAAEARVRLLGGKRLRGADAKLRDALQRLERRMESPPHTDWV